MLWENLHEEEFEAAVKESCGVCALPIGCVETHGQHLPIGTDVIHARGLTALAAEREPVVVFPAQYFGEKSGAGEFRGTIMFSEKLIMEILEESCAEIARNGFKKIAIVNGHGGNTFMLNNFARYMLRKNVDYSVFICRQVLPQPSKLLKEKEKYPELTPEDIQILEAYGDKENRGGHACFAETGWIYGLRPELVNLKRMNEVDGTSTHLFDPFSDHGIYTPFAWMGNYPNSYTGEHHEGMNERIAHAMVECTVSDLADTFKFLKTETISTEYRAQWRPKNFR